MLLACCFRSDLDWPTFSETKWRANKAVTLLWLTIEQLTFNTARSEYFGADLGTICVVQTFLEVLTGNHDFAQLDDFEAVTVGRNVIDTDYGVSVFVCVIFVFEDDVLYEALENEHISNPYVCRLMECPVV